MQNLTVFDSLEPLPVEVRGSLACLSVSKRCTGTELQEILLAMPTLKLLPV